MIPIRCITCGHVVSAHFDEFQKRVEDGENPKEVLDDLGLHKYCCRRMLVTHVDVWKGSG
ncbi:DNA-directed RNA polymerase subunit N [Methanobacterium sp. ACI-7]|uniref:DNA-directed RNA polymerase subunit N n=1 Tax=unclassified Methanobacterium TaxID=2627676 RepID=UPI0039C047D5